MKTNVHCIYCQEAIDTIPFVSPQAEREGYDRGICQNCLSYEGQTIIDQCYADQYEGEVSPSLYELVCNV